MKYLYKMDIILVHFFWIFCFKKMGNPATDRKYYLEQSNLILLPLCLVLSAIYFELLLLLLLLPPFFRSWRRRWRTVEPRYNERLRDWQNLFAITRFRFIVFLFHIFYYYWGKENRSLHRGLRFIAVRDHFTFLGNGQPTPPLSQHFTPSKN